MDHKFKRRLAVDSVSFSSTYLISFRSSLESYGSFGEGIRLLIT